MLAFPKICEHAKWMIPWGESKTITICKKKLILINKEITFRVSIKCITRKRCITYKYARWKSTIRIKVNQKQNTNNINTNSMKRYFHRFWGLLLGRKSSLKSST